MTIGLKQGSVVTEIGPGSILHSLFSTIAVHLEGGKWGSKFPLLLGTLYQGSLSASDATAAMQELNAIKQGLSELPPSKVVWDIDNLNKQPPWGNKIGPHVTSMADYYVSASQRSLITEIWVNLESLKEFGGTLDIVSYDKLPKF